MKKILISVVAIILVVAIVVTSLYLTRSNESQIEIDYDITALEVYPLLETVTTVEAYGGFTNEVEYSEEPTDGNQFLLVKLFLNLTGEVEIDFDDISFAYNGEEYDRIKEDDFLETYNYSALPHGTHSTADSGWIIFEVPAGISLEELETNGNIVIANGSLKVLSDITENNVIYQTAYKGYQERQEELRVQYSQEFRSGDYDAQNPYIVVNPYEIAPLSAMLMFDTENPVSVTTIIDGRDPALDLTTITNTIEEKKTNHEVPLIGLYSGENQITVILDDGENKTEYKHTITTQTDVDNQGLQEVEVVISDLEQVSNGLYQLKDSQRTLVDVNGDVRGYFTIPGISESGIDEVTANGTVYVNINAYDKNPTMYELNYLGYTYKQVDFNDVEMHHDAFLFNETTLLTCYEAVDLTTYTAEDYIDFTKIFDNSHNQILEIRDNHGSDYFHMNTVSYTGEEDSIFVSLRNQHALLKLSYPDMEVEWIMSPYSEGSLENADKYLKPTTDDFEWFYSQHDIRFVGYNEDGTYDITIFDNGVHRGLDDSADYPYDEMYSRIVRYTIDEKNMTVTQNYEFGEELGSDGISVVHGSAQYIPESDTYLGAFDQSNNKVDYGISDDYKGPSKIIEANSNGEVVLQFNLSKTAYRTEKFDSSIFYASFEGENASGEYIYNAPKAQLYDDSLTFEEEEALYQVNDVFATQNYLRIAGWATSQSNPETPVDSVNVLLTNKDNGYSYIYDVDADNAQIKNQKTPAELADTLDESAGFATLRLDTISLLLGEYDIDFIVNQDGKHYFADTPYSLVVSKSNQEIDSFTYTDVFADQKLKEEAIISQYQSEEYKFNNPYIVVNPYGNSPLTANLMFKTDSPAKISVEVQGLRDADNITHSFETMSAEHIVPIYGLYAEEETKVILTATYEDGKTETTELMIKGEAIPNGFNTLEIVSSNTEKMAEGLTFIMPSTNTTYPHAIDDNGEIRWIFSDNTGFLSYFHVLENGNLMMMSDKSTGAIYYVDSLYEIDYNGKIYNEYLINGAHHEILELENGNLLVAGNDITGAVVEDSIYELDRETGEIVKAWDMDDYFAVPNVNEDGVRISDPNYGNDPHDWFHNNSFSLNDTTKSLAISGRAQDAVIGINYDTGELEWIISNPDDVWTEEQETKLLKPIGDDFEWPYGQHNVQWVNENELLMFDNGNFRSKTVEGVVPPDENYSRIVRYKIDLENMTVEQVYEYGADLENPLLAAYISGVQMIADDHYLVNFGGLVYNADGEISYSPFDSITGSGKSVIHEIIGGELVFETSFEGQGFDPAVYRAERLDIYENKDELELGIYGKVLGELNSFGILTENVSMPNNNDLVIMDAQISDNMTSININLKIPNAAADDVASIIFVGENSNFSGSLGTGDTINKIISKAEIPNGQYDLYIKSADTYIDLKFTWVN